MSLFETILRDLHFAIRQLRKRPGFTFTAVAVFAFGIAASTAIFAFVDAALVKPLPYRDPSTLVALFEHIPVGERYHLSYFDYLDWKRLNHALASLDVYRPEPLTLYTVKGTEQVLGARISDGFFRTLGVSPFLGRDFAPGEDQPSAPQTIILSYDAWQKRFAANRNVLGKSITFERPPAGRIRSLRRHRCIASWISFCAGGLRRVLDNPPWILRKPSHMLSILRSGAAEGRRLPCHGLQRSGSHRAAHRSAASRIQLRSQRNRHSVHERNPWRHPANPPRTAQRSRTSLADRICEYLQSSAGEIREPQTGDGSSRRSGSLPRPTGSPVCRGRISARSRRMRHRTDPRWRI